MAVVTLSNPTTISPTDPCLPAAALAVTPSDANTFSQAATLYVGTAGNVVCTPANYNADVTVVCNAGTIIPFRVVAVKATGTTATNILAVY